MKEKVVVIYSGGMDSFTLLNMIKEQHDYDINALSFDYGQRHKKELLYAADVCKELGISHKIVDLNVVNELIQGSALTSDIKVPEGHYADESMKLTVVPNRNMIMLSLAVGYAVSIGATKVWYGAHAGDHAIYPDCRPTFVDGMKKVSRISNYEPVEIETPYLYIDKGDILKIGLKQNLDYLKTWTCYNGREKPCGKCGACVERLEAFKMNNMKDPLEYEVGREYRLTTVTKAIDASLIAESLEKLYGNGCAIIPINDGNGEKKVYNFRIPPAQHPSKNNLHIMLAKELGYKTFTLAMIPEKSSGKTTG